MKNLIKIYILFFNCFLYGADVANEDNSSFKQIVCIFLIPDLADMVLDYLNPYEKSLELKDELWSVQYICWSPSNLKLALSDTNKLRVYNVFNDESYIIKLGYNIHLISWSSDGSKIACVMWVPWKTIIKIIDADSGNIIKEQDCGKLYFTIHKVIWSLDNSKINTVIHTKKKSNDIEIYELGFLWWFFSKTLKGHEQEIQQFSLSDENYKLISADDHRIIIWCMKTKQQINNILFESSIPDYSLSLNGFKLFIITEEDGIDIVDTLSGLRTSTELKANNRVIQWSSDNALLFCTSIRTDNQFSFRNSDFIIYNVISKKEKKLFYVNDDANNFNCVRLINSFNGKKLATWDVLEKQLFIWDKILES